MDKVIKNILDELNTLKTKYDTKATSENEDYYYGKYWGIREAIQVIEKHINN